MTVQEDYQPVFTGKVQEELQAVLQRYPTKQAALLPALWIAQREQGWISDPVMAEVAAALGLSPAFVKGVVTFYTMYHQHPVGKNFVQVCTTSPGACGFATPILVNDDFIENVTPDKVPEIVKKYR